MAAHAERLAPEAHLRVCDQQFYWLWPRRAVELHPCSELESLLHNYDRVVRLLASLSKTVLHGDFYAANVIVAEQGATPRIGCIPVYAPRDNDFSEPRASASGSAWRPEPLADARGSENNRLCNNGNAPPRICPVDWEMAALGPGLLDLAALTAGRWAEEQRTALAQAYYGAWTQTESGQLAWQEFLEALDYCRLHTAVQWLGWAPGWTPPAEQAQDWRGEALRLAGKLNLLGSC
jgi:thiamine kinase-like enzyme